MLADGVRLDFACGDEVYGSCTQLREYLEARGQAYVLRVPSNFHLTLARGLRLTCKQAAARLLAARPPLGGPLRRKGLQGRALVRLGVARHRLPAALPAHPPPPGHRRARLPLLLRPRGPAGVAVPADPRRRLRWPVEEDFEFGKGCFGLDQSQVRLYTAIARHTVLVMAALAICSVTAALLRRRTDTRAPAPVRPDQLPPADPGMIPLTVPETGRLLAHPPTARRRHPLAGLAPPPPGTLSLVPPAHPARPQHRNRTGQIANGCCRMGQ